MRAGSFRSELPLGKFQNRRRGLSDRTVSRRAYGWSKAGRPQNFGGLIIQRVETAARRAADCTQRIESVSADSRQFAQPRRGDRTQFLAGQVQAQMDWVQTGRQRIGGAGEIQELSEFVGVLPVVARFRNWVRRGRV